MWIFPFWVAKDNRFCAYAALNLFDIYKAAVESSVIACLDVHFFV